MSKTSKAQSTPAAATKAPQAKTSRTPRKRRMARESDPAADLLKNSPNNNGPEPAAPEASAPSPTPQRTSKSATVLALLERPGGATLAELIEATGWLPHTTRAALTGLRKKGHVIAKAKRGDVTCYSVTR